MDALPPAHPDLARLAAFGRGTLAGVEMADVESHLAICDSCSQLLFTIADDAFIAMLRTAHTHSPPATGPWSAPSPAATSPMIPEEHRLQLPPSLVISSPDSRTRSGPTPTAGSSPDIDRREPALEEGLPTELLEHPRYRIVRKLGTGGMGSVYLAQHRVMERPVALKVIRRDLLGNAALVERFRREVRAAARLELHPNIVAAHDAEQAGDSHFLVMEFVEGVDLAQLVKSQGPLPYEQACDAIRQAAEGLEHACQRGMVHRDIKPQNLMRTSGGQVKILDFGLARFASDALPDLLPAAEREPQETTRDGGAQITVTDMLLGTADYIAPEQAAAPRSADIRADIYSLGCTLYYLLAGHPPFPEGSLIQKLAAHAEETARPLTGIRPDVPAELASIVDRMMTKDRDSRFQRPGDVAAALRRFCGASNATGDAEDAWRGNETRSTVGIALGELTGTPSPPVEIQDARVVPRPASASHAVRRSLWKRVAALLTSPVRLYLVPVLAGVFVFGWWYSNQVGTLNERLHSHTERPAFKYGGMPQQSAGSTQKSESGAPIRSPTPGSIRVVAPGAESIAGMVVSVSDARLGPVDPSDATEHLSIVLRITNVSSKTIAYESWTRPAVPVLLRGQYANYYNRAARPEQAVTLITPATTITDMLLFESTPVNQLLYLDLPMSGSDEAFRFLIPPELIQRVHYSPDRDPKVRHTVIEEYLEGFMRIERRAVGMPYRQADELRRTETEKLIKSLAQKHKLDEHQVKRIVGREE